ncbi:MAG: UDP-N-acetyl glucosamine 2-epimerase [Chlorobium limicola]|uniref:UDP-N-acetylglucosamine 2-epimerase n=1 Tax=Chlorobium limicola (strain DSM 245 / NBRC 103803 / 6330) TaxID=290315 RepID=B3EI03_CHLL2|nr:UDP-N-acetylglucosamine 2-epimerase [Chlorobium limicola]ACD91412.1 UDP-N-acetylglucosamine 2-epimerase [Chlorobium limicola DSM 245]NTV21138.1 UDP-N-acetyl glucosamine 2-epimerase [Chlorobium limicola]
MKKLLLAAGGKPGALLLAPLYNALKKNGIFKPVAVFAAAQSAEPLSRELATCFGIGEAGHTITLGEDSPGQQLAAVITGMEPIIAREQPVLVMVCGSDNAALGAALAATKLGVPVAVADAGLRCHDRSDADEINRILIDSIADLHFISEHSGEYNLINEGVADEKVFFSGNLSIDTLAVLMEQAERDTIAAELGLQPKKYALVLLNPAGAIAAREPLEMTLRLLKKMSGLTTVLVPLAAGLDELMKQHKLDKAFGGVEGLVMIAHPGHAGLLTLLRDSVLLITDSEELQAESTVMNVPCLTMMDNTARPATIEIGTNVLVGVDEEDIMSRIHDILHSGEHAHSSKRNKIPEKWDGAAASRIVEVLGRVL